MRPSTKTPARTRVERHTNEDVNTRIREEMLARIARLRYASTDEIHERIDELDREWDVERALEANASGVALIGLLLGATVNRRWYALPALVAGFLMQHAVQGWCPPLAWMRRMGIRTAHEIERERRGLEEICRERAPRYRRGSGHDFGLP
jgi:hypothetical protein